MTEPFDSEVTGAGGKVSYTVKELFSEIRDELRQIHVGLSSKADAAAVERLEARMVAVEKVQENQRGSSSNLRWLIPVLVSLAATAIAISSLVGK